MPISWHFTTPSDTTTSGYTRVFVQMTFYSIQARKQKVVGHNTFALHYFAINFLKNSTLKTLKKQFVHNIYFYVKIISLAYP